jgi:hypothetical protein
MVWTFHREGKRLTYEIRPTPDQSAFEIIIHEPEGAERLEQFDSAAAVDERARLLQQQLVNDGWWLASDPRR